MVQVSGVSTSISELNGIGSVTFDAAPDMPESEKEARLRAILGDRGYQRLQEYDRSPKDNRVTRLASRLYFTDTPLSAGQAAQLSSVLAACNQTSRDQPPAEFWAAVRARAGVFLAAPQLAALNDLQAMAYSVPAQPANSFSNSRHSCPVQ
jgi:hypothetical protein